MKTRTDNKTAAAFADFLLEALDWSTAEDKARARQYAEETVGSIRKRDKTLADNVFWLAFPDEMRRVFEEETRIKLPKTRKARERKIKEWLS